MGDKWQEFISLMRHMILIRMNNLIMIWSL